MTVLLVQMLCSAVGCLCAGIGAGVWAERHRIRREHPAEAAIVIPEQRRAPGTETAPTGKPRPTHATSPTARRPAG